MSATRAARSRRRTGAALTPRQEQVLDLLARRYTNARIAEELGLTLAGAKWHVSEIIGVLGVESREEAADWWREHNGLPARLRRWGAAMTPAGSLRWVAAGGATLVAVGAVVLVAAAFAGARGDDEGQPTAVTATAIASASVAPGSPEQRQDGTALEPAPAVGASCPVVEKDICEAALALRPLILAGDVDGIMAKPRLRPFVCPARPAPKPGADPDADLCFGASEGEVRLGFALPGADGLGSTPGWTRARLAEQLPPGGLSALAADNWGPPGLRIGSISCFRFDSQPPGACDPRLIRINFTFIDPSQPPDLQRRVLCIALERDDSGELGFAGVSCSVPPTALLYASTVPASLAQGSDGVLQTYPWTPIP